VSEIRLLAVPYELATLRKGVGRGPERLLELGAEKALGSRGAEVGMELLELDRDHTEHSGDNEIAASFDLMRIVSGRVRAAVREGAFPVVLSGSCFASLGVVGGIEESSPGIVWLDAHSDFNSPESTIEGYLDGMGVRMVTGGAWQGMLASEAGEGLGSAPETAVVLAGARDFDDGEKADLDASSVVQVAPESLRTPEALLAAIEAIEPAPSGLYLHVDLDVLDIDEAPVNLYSAPGGITAAQLEEIVSAVMERYPVRAVSLTAYDPERDADARVPPIALRLLEEVAERVARTPA
jgi:arginase